MNESDNNLLLLLHKWASRQDENFTTEAFVHLLRHLLDHEPKIAVCLLSKLTNGVMSLGEHEIDEVELATQVILEEGRPDFTIRTTNHLIYAEVKVSSTLAQGQLSSYRHELNNADEPHRALIFISLYAETTPMGEEPDFKVRWYTIADWLETEIRNNSFSEPSSAHVLNQFVGFLKGRNMTMERVTWELIGGIQSLMSLLAMIEAALVAENVKFKRSDARDWVGCNIENKKYFLVMRFESPNVLVFHNYEQPIDKQKADSLGFPVYQEKIPVSWRWENSLDLSSEEVHFFARSKESQMECIRHFVHESLNNIRLISATT